MFLMSLSCARVHSTCGFLSRCLHKSPSLVHALLVLSLHVVQVPVISAYQPNPRLPATVIDGIVNFFVEARELASGLTDGSAAPAYNLRTLARSMQYVAHAAPLHGMQRALFDGFGMSFAGMLDAEGAAAIEALVLKHVLGGRPAPGLPSPSKSAPAVLDQHHDQYVNVQVGPPVPCRHMPFARQLERTGTCRQC